MKDQLAFQLANVLLVLTKEKNDLEKEIGTLKCGFIPYLEPGEFFENELGKIAKTAIGRESFNLLTEESKIFYSMMKEKMIKDGLAKIEIGEPYLIVTPIKGESDKWKLLKDTATRNLLV